MNLKNNVLQQLCGPIGGSPGSVTPGDIARALVVETLNIDLPLELNAYAGTVQGELRYVVQVRAGDADLVTLYAWDTAGSVVNMPWVVAGLSGGNWVAVCGVNTSSGKVLGVIDGSVAYVGTIGETLESLFPVVALAATGTPGNVGTLALPEGDWSVTLTLTVNAGATGLTVGSLLRASLSLISATNEIEGVTMAVQSIPALLANGRWSLTVITRINVAAPVTVFAVVQGTYAAGAPTASGIITATRLR